jgi:hypothetical protein
VSEPAPTRNDIAPALAEDDAPDTSATEPLLPDRATPVDIANCPEEELVEAAVAKTTLPLWLCADAAE